MTRLVRQHKGRLPTNGQERSTYLSEGRQLGGPQARPSAEAVCPSGADGCGRADYFGVGAVAAEAAGGWSTATATGLCQASQAMMMANEAKSMPMSPIQNAKVLYSGRFATPSMFATRASRRVA